jgi:hypothetical protein
MHPFGMGHSVTIGTQRNDPVPLGVTLYAGDIPVLAGVSGELTVDLAMAGGAEGRRGFSPVVQYGGCVGFVTDQTVGLRHLGRMRRMALAAVGNGPVALGMTVVTGDFTVSARKRDKFVTHRTVARKAHPLLFPLNDDFQRHVGIVATATVPHLEVGFSGMAQIAVRNVLRFLRTVAVVALLAAHRRFVGHAFLIDGKRFDDMAFYAIAARQRGYCRSAPHHDEGKSRQDEETSLHQRDSPSIFLSHTILL